MTTWRGQSLIKLYIEHHHSYLSCFFQPTFWSHMLPKLYLCNLKIYLGVKWTACTLLTGQVQEDTVP